ncbi:MAG: GNAT family N-acetyltransferase [Sulfurifustis sp.]
MSAVASDTSAAPIVRKALAGDFEQVYRLLRGSPLNSRDLPRENRLRMFVKHWNSDEDYFGYVLEKDGDIVGYMGLMFSRRRIRDQEYKFCEVHSWYVKDEYRNESLRLFFPVVALKGYEITNLTPTEGVADIQKKFGFFDLETHLRIIYPVPSPATFRTRCRIEYEPARIEPLLRGRDQEIFRDHRHLNVLHVRVEDEQARSCYLIAKPLHRRFYEPYGRVFYVGDLDAFLRFLPVLRVRLCWKLRVRCLVMNDAMLRGVKPRFSSVTARDVPSIYKSKRLAKDDIDHLYSTPLVLDYHMQ